LNVESQKHSSEYPRKLSSFDGLIEVLVFMQAPHSCPENPVPCAVQVLWQGAGFVVYEVGSDRWGPHIEVETHTSENMCRERVYEEGADTHIPTNAHKTKRAHPHTLSLSHARDFENYYPWSKTVDFTHILLTIFPSQSYYCLFTYIHTHIRMCSRLNSYT